MSQIPPSDTLNQTLRDRGICVVIPTYNNVGSIEAVVRETLRYCLDVIVVSDGSTDGTAEVLQRLTQEMTADELSAQASTSVHRLALISYTRNRGKGYALREGFREARRQGFSYAITLDGDGQHYPYDIYTFLRGNQEHPGELLVGERQMEGVVRSKGSAFANRFSNFWFYIQTGCPLRDTQTGYRLYPLKKLHGLSLLTSRYEAELELMVFASWHGTRLRSLPVDVFYPAPEERVSHFRPGKDFLRITLLNMVLCLLAIVYGLPLRLFRAVLPWLRTLYALIFFILVMFLVLTPAAWLYVHFGKMTDRKVLGLHKLIYRSARFVMKTHGIPGVRFRETHPADETFERPAVIICNHQSHLDLMAQLVFSPRMIFLTNQWVWHNPFYGFIIRHARYLPVATGIDELLPELRNLVAQGYSICVYPEGTRSRDCTIGRFHKGAFHIAAELGLDILPMYLYGPGKVLPKKNYHLNPGIIAVEVGRRFTQEQLRQMGDEQTQARTLRAHYREKYQQMCNRIEQDI